MWIKRKMTSSVSVSYHSSSSEDDEHSDEDAQNTFDADEENSSSDESQSKPEQKEKVKKTNQGNKNAIFDVMTKILRKQTPTKGSVILSKAATDRQLAKKRKQKELESQDAVKAKKRDDDSDLEREAVLEKMKKKFAWENMGREKPSVTDKEKERSLQKIATRGVVQLFNAVRKQQKILESKLEEVGPSVRKREKVLKSISRGQFLDILKGTSTSNVKSESLEEKTKKEPDVAVSKEDSKPSWDILREDFMLDAGMKDWDRASDADHNNDICDHSATNDLDSDT